MRAFLLTVAIVLIAFVVKVDLTEGTLSLAAFYPKDGQNTLCEDQREPAYITVETIQGDTIHSLFALHPAKMPMTFPEHWSSFIN
ncbi:LysM domain-containing protein OS=Lysinibacillus sphaericus OX=1421 GN=LS41612_08470 PE=4 SV=1 [Lysinibacillus sphaericus]